MKSGSVPEARCKRTTAAYTVRMDNRLTADEASRLYDALFPHVNYLLRLRKRFEELRIADDPLYAEVCDAYQAAWSLRQAVHGRSTRMGAR